MSTKPSLAVGYHGGYLRLRFATLTRAGAGDTRRLMSEMCREPIGLGGCVLGIKHFSSNYYRRQGPRWPLRAFGRPFEPEEAWMTEGPRRGSSTLRNRHSPQSHFHPTGSSLPGGGIDPSGRPAGPKMLGRSLAVTLGGRKLPIGALYWCTAPTSAPFRKNQR